MSTTTTSFDPERFRYGPDAVVTIADKVTRPGLPQPNK